MFKKPLADLKTSAPLRSSDRRKLKQKIVQFYSLLPEDGDLLVPDGLLSVKLVTHIDQPGVAYLSPIGGDPLWICLGKDSDDLIPTVYTLWKKPDLLPSVSTPSAVIPVLVSGADLMVPGVVQHSTSLAVDQLVAITQYHPPSNNEFQIGPPLAIGRMAISTDQLGSDGVTRGKAVHLIHTWKDHLYNMGTKSDPPLPRVLEGAGTIDDEGEHRERPEQPVIQPLQDNASITPLVESDSTNPHPTTTLTAQEISELLRTTIVQCVVTTLSELPQSSFPIPATTFYTSYLLPCRPFYPTSTSSTPVDIKHSTYKSLTAFLKICAKDGLIKVKEGKGETLVTGINATHKDAEGHIPWRTMKDVEMKKEKKEAREREEEEKKRKQDRELQITQFWKPHLRSVILFKAAGKDTTSLYSEVEVKAILNEYIIYRQLLNPRDRAYVNVASDQALLEALTEGKSKEGDLKAVEFLKRDEIVKKLIDRMQAWYEIAGRGKESVIMKGQLKPISVLLKKIQPNRTATLVTGIERFFLDANELADDLKKSCASSTSVNTMAAKSSEVMVQGKQIKGVTDLLIAKGVPKKWIETSVK